MKYRAKETAWFEMKYLTKGMEFDAPDDFDATWAERLEEKPADKPAKPVAPKPTAQEHPAQSPKSPEPKAQEEKEADAKAETVQAEKAEKTEQPKSAKTTRIPRKPTAKDVPVE